MTRDSSQSHFCEILKPSEWQTGLFCRNEHFCFSDAWFIAQNFSCGWLCPLLVVWYYIWLSASGLSPWHWGSLCISAVAATCDALSITFLVAGKLMGAPFSLVRKCAGKPLLQLWRCGAQRGREFETASFAKP